MRIRSWMAARTLVACLALAAIASVAPARADLGASEGDPEPVANTVRLEIQITGLGRDGARVEIKPAHPGCKFKAAPRIIAKGGTGDVVKIPAFAVAATSTSADRDCSFEITVTEPGRKPKVFRRGLQLVAPGEDGTTPVRTLKCYLPATTLAAKDDAKAETKRR